MPQKKTNDKNNKKTENIILTDIVQEMEESYLAYAMSVITSRALPDVKDGLKPVHRRILYVMHEMGLTAGAKFRKSAAIVGTTLARYHPHGDTAVYDAMVNMAQDFSYRYPLVIGQGNFGSVDGDRAAAQRYTEAKMSKISEELLRDIEKDTVDFRPNYDGALKEPVVLPAAVPSLLLNGTLGIAVGMATNIPPHNLGEIVDACIYLIENKDATTEDMTKFIKGPDFPTGGIVYDEGLSHAYGSGRGGIKVRGEAEIIESKAGQFQIIITSLPFRTNKADLVSSIAELVRDRKLEGIKDIRDESTRDVRIVIDLKGAAIPQKVLNFLYKKTVLESAFHFNMVVLVDGIPQTLSLKSILAEFIKHRQTVVRRRAQFNLTRAEEREHILLGLKKALDHIGEIIKLIRGSKDVGEAKGNLIKKFKFSERQVVAILEMKLQKLAKLEQKSIENELKEKQKLINELKILLKSPKKILDTVARELKKIKEQYADERRTKIIAGGVKVISIEDLIPQKESMLVFTSGGYVKRSDPEAFRPQRRGGSGVVDLITKEEDFITHFITASTHSDMLFFTNLGKVYQLKMYEIPEGKRATKGKSIMNFLSLSSGERVTSILEITQDKKKQAQYLLLVTKGGIAKKVATDSFKDVRRSGIRAIRLSRDDELVVAFGVSTGDEVVVVTAEGQSIHFKQSDIRTMSRAAGGVRAIKLSGEDMVVDAHAIAKGDKGFLLVMSENGFGKKTKIGEYKVQKRGGSGIKTAKITEKTGKLVDSKIIKEETELIAISRRGQVIRIDLDSVPSLSRATQGVKIMKLKAGDSIASMTTL